MKYHIRVDFWIKKDYDHLMYNHDQSKKKKKLKSKWEEFVTDLLRG